MTGGGHYPIRETNPKPRNHGKIHLKKKKREAIYAQRPKETTLGVHTGRFARKVSFPTGTHPDEEKRGERSEGGGRALSDPRGWGRVSKERKAGVGNWGNG